MNLQTTYCILCCVQLSRDDIKNLLQYKNKVKWATDVFPEFECMNVAGDCFVASGVSVEIYKGKFTLKKLQS